MSGNGGSISSVADDSIDRVERFYELIAPKLELVEEALRRNFVSEIRTISEVGAHILLGGGKRLRPILLLLVSRMLGYRGTRDVAFAAVVEFIHTATLVHDDIIDEAAVRRGRISVNYGWGNHLTVLVGDYLYTYAMQMALEEGNLEILRLLSTTTIRMTEGEIIGLERNGSIDLSLDDYFEIVGRKTGGLFGATCQIPALLTGASPESAQALHEFGYNLGVCFQLIDDLLDFTSSTEVLGKPALSDLKEGKMTLPLILALPHMTRPERSLVESVALERTFGSVSPDEIIAIVDRYGAVDRTRVIAQEFADRSRIALAGFPPSEARDALEYGLEFVLTRDH